MFSFRPSAVISNTNSFFTGYSVSTPVTSVSYGYYLNSEIDTETTSATQIKNFTSHFDSGGSSPVFSGNQFTAPKTGKYYIGMNFLFKAGNGVTSFKMYLASSNATWNGVPLYYNSSSNFLVNNQIVVNGSVLINLNAGDTIQYCFVQTGSISSNSIIYSSGSFSDVSGYFVST